MRADVVAVTEALVAKYRTGLLDNAEEDARGREVRPEDISRAAGNSIAPHLAVEVSRSIARLVGIGLAASGVVFAVSTSLTADGSADKTLLGSVVAAGATLVLVGFDLLVDAGTRRQGRAVAIWHFERSWREFMVQLRHRLGLGALNPEYVRDDPAVLQLAGDEGIFGPGEERVILHALRYKNSIAARERVWSLGRLRDVRLELVRLTAKLEIETILSEDGGVESPPVR